MQLKYKIDKLMKNKGIKTYSDLLIRIFNELNIKDKYEKVKKEKANFSKMLDGERPLKKEYFIPIEKIFGIRIVDLLDEEKQISAKYYNKGLRYTAACNDYNKFLELARESGEELSKHSYPIIFRTDEYDNGVLDYIIEYRANEGLRFLANEYGLQYNSITCALNTDDNNLFWTKDINGLADLLFECDDGDIFIKVFNPYSLIKNATRLDDDRLIYNKSDFLNKILNTNNIFKNNLTMRKFSLNDINRHSTFFEEDNFFVNPLLNKLLELAIEDPKKYNKKVNDILDYGIKNNPLVIKNLEDSDKFLNFKFDINNIGLIIKDFVIYGSLITINDNYINLDISSEIKNKMTRIKEINNTLLLRETTELYPFKNKKRIQKNADGNIIKLHTENYVEYEMFKNFKDSTLPISKLLRTKENVDEFLIYNGTNDTYNFNNEQLINITMFLKRFHKECYKFLKNKVYVHGQICNENLYFLQDDLTCITNWDDCYIGEYYEDIVSVIVNISGVKDIFRNNKEVYNNVKTILITYETDYEQRKVILNEVDNYIKNLISKLDFKNDTDSKEYELLIWSKAFFDIYKIKLLED